MKYSKSKQSKDKVKSFLAMSHGDICQYCGKSTAFDVAQLDHIIPLIEGGSNEISNMRYACKSCNVGKNSKPLEDFRLMKSIHASEYHPTINYKQYRKLMALGLLTKEVELITFHFEKEI